MSFHDMLSAREARWIEKTRMAREHNAGVVSMTLRMSAQLRLSSEARAFFDISRERFEEYCQKNSVEISARCVRDSEDGPYCLWTTPDARAAKRVCMAYEDHEPGGELTDIDVMDASARAHTRDNINGAPRPCLVCGCADARECILRLAHTPEETTRACLARLRAAMER